MTLPHPSLMTKSMISMCNVDSYKMDPDLREWIMTHSEVLKLFLEGEDESEFANYFSDKQRDLADLDLIRQGVREPCLWHACNYYSISSAVPEFVDLYLNDLRNARRWDIVENIDEILIVTLGPGSRSGMDSRRAIRWLVRLVQYGEQLYLDDSPPETGRRMDLDYRRAIFTDAYVWSMELLTLALRDVRMSKNLATAIYRSAAKRSLLDLMKFAHERDAYTFDGCKYAVASGNVECLRLSRKLGGSITRACAYAAEVGNAECLRAAHELGSKLDYSCTNAAMNGHAECLRLASELGDDIGESCELAAARGHIECLRLAHQLGGELGSSCTNAAMNGHVECLRAAVDIGAELGEACEKAAESGDVECLEFACMAGGDTGDSCWIAAENGFLDCLKIAWKYGGSMEGVRDIVTEREYDDILEWLDTVADKGPPPPRPTPPTSGGSNDTSTSDA